MNLFFKEMLLGFILGVFVVYIALLFVVAL